MENFSVIYRDPGHWDIYSNEKRLFRIRGGPSKYFVEDDRNDKQRWFKTVGACMHFICDELMYELIIVE